MVSLGASCAGPSKASLHRRREFNQWSSRFLLSECGAIYGLTLVGFEDERAGRLCRGSAGGHRLQHHDSITWDNGWQMLWEANSIASVTPSASGANTIVFKDSILQQFRSGIRVKFD